MNNERLTRLLYCTRTSFPLPSRMANRLLFSYKILILLHMYNLKTATVFFFSFLPLTITLIFFSFSWIYLILFAGYCFLTLDTHDYSFYLLAIFIFHCYNFSYDFINKVLNFKMHFKLSDKSRLDKNSFK